MAGEFLKYRQIPQRHISPLSGSESIYQMAHRTDPAAKIIYYEYEPSIKKGDEMMKTGAVLFIGSAITMTTAIIAHRPVIDPNLAQNLLTGSFYGSLLAFGIGAGIGVGGADKKERAIFDRNRQLGYPLRTRRIK